MLTVLKNEHRNNHSHDNTILLYFNNQFIFFFTSWNLFLGTQGPFDTEGVLALLKKLTLLQKGLLRKIENSPLTMGASVILHKFWKSMSQDFHRAAA